MCQLSQRKTPLASCSHSGQCRADGRIMYSGSVKIAAEPATYAKALLRILIADLRVNSRREILPTYRVGAPVVCAQTSSVEVSGLEPRGQRLLAS